MCLHLFLLVTLYSCLMATRFGAKLCSFRPCCVAVLCWHVLPLLWSLSLVTTNMLVICAFVSRAYIITCLLRSFTCCWGLMFCSSCLALFSWPRPTASGQLLSCLVLSWLVLFCLVLSCLVLSCFVFACFLLFSLILILLLAYASVSAPARA